MAMVTPFLASKLSQEALSAGVSGVTGGMGQLISGATMFDKGDQRRLAYLNEQQRRGAGATQAQDSRIRSQYAQARGGQMATQAMRDSDTAAMLASNNMLSGRDLFQQEIAAQEAEEMSRREERQALRQADREARMARRQEQMALRQAQRERRRQMIMGGTQMALSTALGIGLPFLEKGINTRRARLAKQATDRAATSMSNPTPAMSTSVGNYGGVFGRATPDSLTAARGTGFDNVPDQVRPPASGRARAEHYMGADKPMTLEQAFAAVR